MSSGANDNPDGTSPLVVDRFRADVSKGAVHATSDGTGSHATRHITDAEHMISIDHGALRIPMLAKPGFGRAALSYGPFDATPGLAMAVWMLNGHNTSQTLHTYSLLKQAYRFLRGGNAFSVPQQIIAWHKHPARESLLRRIECWIGVRRAKDAGIKDNMMVGFFADAKKPALGSNGHAFVMRAASHECGDLRISGSSSFTPDTNAGTTVVYGFQNVEAMYVVALREGSALCYLAATPGARGAANPGMMRPVAVERLARPHPATPLYAGVHQSVLGEIGFAVDSRVSGVVVDNLPNLATRFGGAHAVEGTGQWSSDADRRITTPSTATGLIAAQVSSGSGLLLRLMDAANHWRISLNRVGDQTTAILQCILDGSTHEIAHGIVPTNSGDAATPAAHDVLIIDDGNTIALRVNGHTIGDPAHTDTRLADARGVGSFGPAVTSFEAHPREVPIPDSFRIHEPWAPRSTTTLLHDNFAGTVSELDGRTVPGTPSPSPTWQRTFGSGRFDILPSGGAKVRGEPGNPCPMRTLYTLPWTNPAFADIEARLTPPGTGRFQRQGGRSGLVLWQDAKNHLIVNLWLHDGYAGASISSFLVFDGFDDVYNAVWTNIGPRVQWNKPFRLGVAFDGDRYLVRVDDEPVLFRRLTDVYPKAPRFQINRVGMAANWEWGLDTGTLFHDFTGRA